MTVTTTEESLPLRERKRLRAMKRVQEEAVSRFLAEGFDPVTVEQIAEAADVSAMSVYRWFGTKEGLVIWDEFDPPILESIGRRLPGQPPLEAVRDAFVELLDDVYDRERDMALARAQLIYREPAVLAAADRNLRHLRSALSEMFTGESDLEPLQAEATAAIATALLEVAIDAWQRVDGTRPLHELIAELFDGHRHG